jgi:FKBP-type peptidyl-prolyl cis-trans isomerase (trigger factor)
MLIRERFDEHIAEHFDEYVTVEIPHNVMLTATQNAIRSHQARADDNDQFGTFSEYLKEALSAANEDDVCIREFVRRLQPTLEPRITAQLIFQAIAETLDIKPTADDVKAHWESRGGIVDELTDEDIRNMKSDTLGWLVRNHIIENSVALDLPPLAD